MSADSKPKRRLGRGFYPPNENRQSSSSATFMPTNLGNLKGDGFGFRPEANIPKTSSHNDGYDSDPYAHLTPADYGYGRGRMTNQNGAQSSSAATVTNTSQVVGNGQSSSSTPPVKVDAYGYPYDPEEEARLEELENERRGGFGSATDKHKATDQLLREMAMDPRATRNRLYMESFDERDLQGFGTSKAAEPSDFGRKGGANRMNMTTVSRKHRQLWESEGPVVRNVYKTHPDVQALTDEQVRAIRAKDRCTVVDQNESPRTIPKPCCEFDHAFEQYPEIIYAIENVGFESPTPIQAHMWPMVMSGHDTIGIAQTGSGKTLAFLLPAFIHMYAQKTPMHKRWGPTILVLSPTRELALQIESEVRKYKYRESKSMCIYGGDSKSVADQAQLIRQSVNIVIATPGRLKDLMERDLIHLASVTYVVLDEADRMLDQGFEVQIRGILDCTRPDRQTVMTSATWPKEENHPVRKLAATYMANAMVVHFGLDLTACADVTQNFERCDRLGHKKDVATAFVGECVKSGGKCIVFVNTKLDTNNVFDRLCADFGHAQVRHMHGDIMQMDRERALKEFRSGVCRVLVATDVASRGLDVSDVTHVLNYDFPNNDEEYVHRVGRTGRAGKKGQALSLIYMGNEQRGNDAMKMEFIVQIMQNCGHEIPQSYKTQAAMNKNKRESGRTMDSGGGRSRGGQSYEYRTTRVENKVIMTNSAGGSLTAKQISDLNMPLFTNKRHRTTDAGGVGLGGSGGSSSRPAGRGFGRGFG